MLIQIAQLQNIYEESVFTSVRLACNFVYVSSGTFKLVKGRLERKYEMAEGMNN
jgi:hypothetical protein